MTIEVRLDDHGVQELLDRFTEKSVNKVLKRAVSAYGKAARPILRAATPVGPPGHASITRGSLQKAVRYKQVRARYGIGVVVAPMGKAAFHRHFVTGGTKAHRIPKAGVIKRLVTPFGVFAFINHPGARANPFVARSAGAVEAAGLPAAEAVIFQALEATRAIESEGE
jgi:hypothetical protein